MRGGMLCGCYRKMSMTMQDKTIQEAEKQSKTRKAPGSSIEFVPMIQIMKLQGEGWS
jgi:hypothetical protein